MGKTLRLIGVLLLVAVPIAWTAVRAAEPPAAKDTVVKMEEVSAFDAKEVGPYGQISSGVTVSCTTTPDRVVKTYPKLKSKQPLYGTLTFGGGPAGSPPVIKYHFVLDQSEEKPPAAEKPKAAAGASQKPAAPASVTVRSVLVSPGVYAIEESGASAKYDLLYFDANRDLDLTNDPPIDVMKDPPKGLPMGPNFKVFDAISVEVPLGGDAGTAKFRVVPMLQVYTLIRPMPTGQIPAGAKVDVQPVAQAYVRFMSATVRKANLRIGEKEYLALLLPAGIGRYDVPLSTRLLLTPVEEIGKPRVTLAPEYIGAMRQFDGKLYCFRTTPRGDELRFGPYRGDLGVLEVGPGGRAITDLGFIGGLQSRDTFVPLGETTLVAPKEYPRRHMVPVGDYQPVSLTVQYGRLRFSSRVLTQTVQTTADGQPPRTPAYPIQIRKDKPVVLEFSGKPEVMFLGPANGQSFKPGDTVSFSAMLTERWQGITITGLWDTTQKKGEVKYRLGTKELTGPEYLRLDPNIVVRNSKGEKLAEGKMPFG